VGLSGGAGAGKSTVARRLKELGAVVIDADALAREVVEPGTDGLRDVVEAFGHQVLRPDGSLDRAALAAVVFADPEQRRRLEQITHPRIAARTSEILASAPDDAVVVHDVPLLVEKGLAPAYDVVVIVDATFEGRVQRLVGRGLSEADARARIAAQATEEERRAVADVWLENDGSTDELVRQVDLLWHERLSHG
jgi:dephospho-CoA kinase